MAQLAARYQVQPSQIQSWKKPLTEGAAGVFGNGQEQKAKNDPTQSVRPEPRRRATDVRTKHLTPKNH